MLTDEHPLGEEFFKSADSKEAKSQEALPVFPEPAWRGIFADYRKANERATEASDVFHFAALWARCAAALGRRVHFSYGMTLYPNVYVVCFGPTGDRKTTATRQATELGNGIKIISGGGSGEGLADAFSQTAPGEGTLIHAEELSQILRPGRWEGSTLIPFLTQCFDCPGRYEMKFRKSPVSLERPTPNLLAGVTPEWFWRDFRVNDFQGGFGNRMFFVTGGAKDCVPRPASPDLFQISRAVEGLSEIEPREARFEGEGRSAVGPILSGLASGRKSPGRTSQRHRAADPFLHSQAGHALRCWRRDTARNPGRAAVSGDLGRSTRSLVRRGAALAPAHWNHREERARAPDPGVPEGRERERDEARNL
jgi:hypothetical protein